MTLPVGIVVSCSYELFEKYREKGFFSVAVVKMMRNVMIVTDLKKLQNRESLSKFPNKKCSHLKT